MAQPPTSHPPLMGGQLVIGTIAVAEQANVYNPTFNQAVAQMGHLGLIEQQAHGLINNMAIRQAAQLGVNDLFYISAAIFVVLITQIWITRPERAGGGDAGAAASAAH